MNFEKSFYLNFLQGLTNAFAQSTSNIEKENRRREYCKERTRMEAMIAESIRNRNKEEYAQNKVCEAYIQMSKDLAEIVERAKRCRECARMFQKVPKCHHVVNAGNKDECWEQLRIEIAKEELLHLLKLRENTGVYFDKPMEVLAVEYADTFIKELQKKGASNEEH